MNDEQRARYREFLAAVGRGAVIMAHPATCDKLVAVLIATDPSVPLDHVRANRMMPPGWYAAVEADASDDDLHLSPWQMP